ncbi:MAG: right-handed parallel beta-helix repeat-containing protein [Planctomycetes bacterium]|nr:right-handed parallel beta-helix repeat-containing protein [Planctomycetota bacterium]
MVPHQRRMTSWYLGAWSCVLGLTVMAPAEVLYVGGHLGRDNQAGTASQPLKTLAEAAGRINASHAPGPTTIKVAPGMYCLDRSVVIENCRPYTEQDRLTIEATVAPDDPNWSPALMPVLLSIEDPRPSGNVTGRTETYSLVVRNSHVTIRGLKFLGNPLPNNWHCCVSRIGKELDDLLVTQCLFLGSPAGLDIYCAALATGDRFRVDHSIFRQCHASVVFWDGPDGLGGKQCAMRYCLVEGASLAGVWTCRTRNDLEFHHNVVTHSEYFWMRKTGDSIPYRLRDCVVTDVKHNSGYGVESGATGPTGPEVTYEEHNVVRQGRIILDSDPRARSYLHVAPGTLGSDLGTGLFRAEP